MRKRRFFVLIAVPYLMFGLAMILPFFISSLIKSYIHMEGIPYIEQYEMNFNVERSPLVTGILRSPFPEKSLVAYPSVPLREIAPPPERKHDLSLIMIGPDTRIAIIDGMVIREGDIFGNKRVLRITEKGLLVSEGGVERFIRIPEERNIRIIR